jgi:hypothetical protein
MDADGHLQALLGPMGFGFESYLCDAPLSFFPSMT